MSPAISGVLLFLGIAIRATKGSWNPWHEDEIEYLKYLIRDKCLKNCNPPHKWVDLTFDFNVKALQGTPNFAERTPLEIACKAQHEKLAVVKDATIDSLKKNPNDPASVVARGNFNIVDTSVVELDKHKE